MSGLMNAARYLLVAGAVANLDFFGTSDMWWLDMSTMRQGGRGHGAPGAMRGA